LSLVAPDRTIYVGTFTNATGDPNGPSHLYAYSPDGLMLRDWTIQGQSADGDNGIQVAARDASGKLYLLDQNPPRVIAFDPHTGTQSTYATFGDVPTCPVLNRPQPNCSDTVMDNPPEPDYAAWGPDGSLYVTDYEQGLIWRAPQGGGKASVWFTDSRLDGTLFGPAGIVLMPDHRTLMLDTSAGGGTSIGNPTSGKLYKLPIRPDGSPGALQKVWESGPAQAPDGFALAQSGNVYMALVGPGTNQLVEISPNGNELSRSAGPIANQQLSVPFDEPSSVQFDGDRMIVTNDAYFSGDETHWVLYDVWAGEPGAPVYVPGA
jgi:sugar lactone lactonase YvrE